MEPLLVLSGETLQAARGRRTRCQSCFNPAKNRWYVDASWASDPVELPTVAELRARAGPVLAVDLNADHLACHAVAADGNPLGHRRTVECDPGGPSARRDGQRRAAITELLDTAEAHGCEAVAVENLGFEDARRTGRETMGRGRRGKQFRRTVAGMPTGKFRDDLAAMAHRRGVAVVAVDPAYTSKWGGEHWLAYLNATRSRKYSRHHAAAVVIGRRWASSIGGCS